MSFSWGAGTGSMRTEGLPVVRAVPMPDVPVGPPRAGDLLQLAAELAPMTDVWQRLLDQHVPDRGGRCVRCTKGGTGIPSTPWPCSIHGVADLARRRHHRAQVRPA